MSTGLYSALSILALLYSRDAGSTSSSHGNTVGVSLFDTMTDLMGYPLTFTQHSGVDQQPLGMSSPAVAPYGAYRTSDGQTVVLGTTNDAEWQRLSRQILDVAARQPFRDSPVTPVAARTATCWTTPSAPGARRTTWNMCRRLPMPRASAMRATTCRARFWCTHRFAAGIAGGRSTQAGPISALLFPPVILRLSARHGRGARTRAAHRRGARRTRHRRRRNRRAASPRRHRTGLPLMSEESVLLLATATVCGR